VKQVTIYTDGACSGNPGPGGWGAILRYDVNGKNYEREISGAEPATTNNRMELSAAIKALSLLSESCEVALYSDSKYVVDGLSKGWAKSWQKKNWRKSDGKPALNVDLWERLLKLCDAHKVKIVWVKGHADNEFNKRCDALAVRAYKELGKTD
jgi:ribonuclease HI